MTFPLAIAKIIVKLRIGYFPQESIIVLSEPKKVRAKTSEQLVTVTKLSTWAII